VVAPELATEAAAAASEPPPDTAGTPGGAGASYPAEWEADVVLRDGGTAHLRPIRPDDAEALQRFHLGQSPESVYLRFFAPMPRLSDSDLYRFTHVDHTDRVAFVATVGDQIIGVGRYDRINSKSAEVAFNISDHHHGRGLGSVLLEHLAAAAREHGIHRFDAEVLPQNRKMMAVFMDAGYQVTHHYEDGVITLHFYIDPTEESMAVMEAREHRAEARSVQALLNPGSVAVVGPSRREDSIGHHILANLLGGHFAGKVYVVHPEAEAILGVPAHRSLADIGEPVDLAVIAVPAESVLGVVKDAAATGVHGVVVISGDFAESGPEGFERQKTLVSVARANGLRVVGPNSFGIMNATSEYRLNASFAPVLPSPGGLALFCQSGALSVSVLDSLRHRGLGLSTFLSAGNRGDVSTNDCMQFWEEDPHTAAIGLYLESTGNPRKFSRIARRLSRHKPVIVVKSGTSGFGVPPGHAVRVSRAPREAFDAMLKQSGCIRVDNVHQLFDVAQLVLHQPLPEGPGVAVVANSHSLATIIADACASSQLRVVRPPSSLPAMATADQFRAALTAAFADDDVDSVVAAFVPPVSTGDDDVAAAVIECAGQADKPIVACFLGMLGVQEQLAGTSVVPTYPTPEEAVRALAAVTWYGSWRRRDPGLKMDLKGIEKSAARRFVEEIVEQSPDGVKLDNAQAARLLGHYGVELWPVTPVSTMEDAVAASEAVGWPVVLKTTESHLRHRTDLGGVRLDIAGPDDLVYDFTQMQETLLLVGGGDLVIQRMAPPGVACVVRSVEDPLFGPVVSFGLGGDASELLGDVAHRIPPLTEQDVGDLVRSVRAAPKLFGHRGAHEVDTDALEEIIARVSRLADDLPEVLQLELNPVVVAERGAFVLGATVRLAHPEQRADPGIRELTASR